MTIPKDKGGALDASIDAIFKGALVVSTPRAQMALDLGSTKFHELLSAGILRSVKIGRSRRVYVESIKELLESGVPVTPKVKPLIKRPS